MNNEEVSVRAEDAMLVHRRPLYSSFAPSTFFDQSQQPNSPHPAAQYASDKKHRRRDSARKKGRSSK